MKVLQRKLVRELVSSWGLLSAIIAIIAVGVASFITLTATYANLETAKVDYYSRSRMADFWVSLKKAPISAVEQVGRIEGISAVRGRLSFPVIVDFPDTPKPVSGQVLTLPADPKPVINGVVMSSGSYFSPTRRNEVIVSRQFAEKRKIYPGQQLTLIMNGQRKQLFVVGTASSSEYIYLQPPGSFGPDPMNYGVFWIKRSYAEEVFNYHGACNDIVGLFSAEALASPDQTLKRINDLLSEYGVYTTTPRKTQPSNMTLTAEMGGLQQMATVLPIIFLAVAAMVLNVLMTRLAEQQRTIVGTLKALGYTNTQVMGHFLGYGLFVGAVGGVLGCVMGYWLADGMTLMYSTVFSFPKLANVFYPGFSGIAVAISLFFAMLGTIRGVRHVAQLNPAEAMRAPAPPVGKKILLERLPFFWRCLGYRWQMVLRGIFRNTGRSVIAILAAALGSSMVLMALGMNESLMWMVDFQFQKVQRSDINLTLRNDVDLGALDAANRLPGVYRVEPILHVACTFEHGVRHKKGSITGLIAGATMTTPSNEDGQRITVPSTGLLMTRRLAALLDVKAGDRVSFTPVRGLRHRHTVPVAGLIDSTFGLAVYADYKYLNRLIDSSGAVSEIQLKASQSPAMKDQFYRQIKQYPQLAGVTYTQAQYKSIRKEFIDKMGAMVNVIILFAAVIFFGSILNGSLIALAERQREIATFRVLGYRPLEVGNLFLRENMLLNMIGAVLGLPLGYWMLWGMSLGFRNDMYAMPCIVSWSTYLWAIVLAFAFVIGAQWIVQMVVNRLNWPDALKMKE